MNNISTPVPPKQARCPKCGGKVFLDKDFYGWYAHCLQCGHLRDLDQIIESPAKTRGAVHASPTKSLAKV